MPKRELLSFCRLCVGQCATVVTVDEHDHLVAVRGDHDDSQTLGYACFKGMRAAEAHNTSARIIRPLKRMDDGSFRELALEQALDEIAETMRGILERDGPPAFGGFLGGGGLYTSSAAMLSRHFLHAIGSQKMYSPNTIDQSAKSVAAGRIGTWPAGRVPFGRGDVFLIFGGNPLLSVATPGFDTRNPTLRLKQARARGMKLIVVDPRFTETARQADVFLQPLPGEDPSILASLIRIILAEGWHDHAFCARHVADLGALRSAVEPFTPAYAAARADVPVQKLREVAEVFAQRRGQATSCTGPDMAPHSNLSEHLIEVLNVICGRYLREGERIGNPGVLTPRLPRKAQAQPARRPWEQGARSRDGKFGMIDGEMCTGTLADEILAPGPERIRCFINHGGNPASSVPDQRKIVRALRSLELLVSIEPFMTATAQLSHYILPPRMMYERPDLPLYMFEQLLFPEPYTRYTPAVAAPPKGSELVDDVYVFWSLAKRLGLQLEHSGVPLDMEKPPTVDDILSIIARHAPIPFAELRQLPRGGVFDGEPQCVEPADPGYEPQFTVMPADVLEELAQVCAEVDDRGNYTGNGRHFTHRLSVRRHRDLFNSTYRYVPTIRARLPHNLAYLAPQEMTALGLAVGEWVEIESDAGVIEALARADPTLRSGVVAITHGFGALPDQVNSVSGYLAEGVAVNLLISGERDREPINAMPRMSAIPVNLRRAPRNDTAHGAGSAGITLHLEGT